MRFMFEMRGDGCVGDNRTGAAAAAAALIRLPVASFFWETESVDLTRDATRWIKSDFFFFKDMGIYLYICIYLYKYICVCVYVCAFIFYFYFLLLFCLECETYLLHLLPFYQYLVCMLTPHNLLKGNSCDVCPL